MAQRNKTPLSFASITYDQSNKDKRWYVDLPTDLAALTGLDSDSALADVITNLVASNGCANSGNPLLVTDANTVQFGNPADTIGKNHGDVTIAYRIPQTKRILDFVLQQNNDGSDINGKFASGAMEYTIYVSGRSDKKYTEIIDWVKVADNSGQLSDLNTNVFLPAQVGSDTYVTNNANKFHVRSFPYYTSWVKIVFHNVSTAAAEVAGAPDLSLGRILLYDFQEDTQDPSTGAEKAPTVEMVFPSSGSKWLPSQTVYFTARAYEPNTDACHFSFEIYKETTSNTTLDGGDTLMYTIDSNALNLDGSVNENFTHTWSGLPLRTVSVTNKVFLPGYPMTGALVSPRSVLIVPTAGNTVGAPVNLGNVRFFDNVGNSLKYDAVANGVTFTPINIPTDASVSATGWLIVFPTETKFNRIDFLNPSSGLNPTKVEIFYCTDEVASGYKTVTNGVWDTNGVTTVFRGPAWESKVEFCWPAVSTVGNYHPDAADRPVVGYKEGIPTEITDDADLYNPDRNGRGIDQTNLGDWTKVPKFSGLLVGPAFASIDTTVNPDTYVASSEYGDSPIPVTATGAGTAYLLSTGSGITTVDSPLTKSKNVCERIVYVRVALPDPYQDGDRFYAKCKVWDGRTQIV